MVSKVPVAFDYELTVLTPTLDFKIAPLKGEPCCQAGFAVLACVRVFIHGGLCACLSVRGMAGVVPANGATEIAIEFCPKRSVTSEVQVKVKISQFGFEPFVSRVFGSSVPTEEPIM